MFLPGELPLALLAVLEQDPQNGYELMQALRSLFGKGYRPSAGGIYPALAALEAEGLIQRLDGDESRFQVMPEGERALKSRAPALARLEGRTGVRFGDKASLAALLARFTAGVMDHVGRVPVEQVEEILDAARSAVADLAKGDPNGA